MGMRGHFVSEKRNSVINTVENQNTVSATLELLSGSESIQGQSWPVPDLSTKITKQLIRHQVELFDCVLILSVFVIVAMVIFVNNSNCPT